MPVEFLTDEQAEAYGRCVEGLGSGKTKTIYQLIDDATRYDVGTLAYARDENSADAKHVLEQAILRHGAPDEVLSDNSLTFNQLRRGVVGPVEIFLASHGTMPISGLPGRPTTQGKNERSHQTLIRSLDANQLASLDQLQGRINIFREHYNKRRPHQALGQATPAAAWELLEHTPATSPIPLVVLEAKASEYRQLRNAQARDLDRSRLTVSKTGETRVEESVEREGDQSLVEVTGANRLVYYHGYHVKLPSTYADRQFYRILTVDEFSLADPRTGLIVFSFPLPLRALNVRGRYVSSYAIRGIQLSHPTKHWERKHAEIKAQFDRREEDYPEVFIR